MGLRSPQELEQVQLTAPNMPLVEAGKTSTIDLATPVSNFMEQKAIGDQIDAVNKIVVTRKDALVKIKSKYAVESVTSEYKSRIAALAGNNAITEGQDLLRQATRAAEDLAQKAPADLASRVQMDSRIKIQELQTLVTDKMAVEGRKAAIDTGNAVTKLYTDEAASKFRDHEGFKKEYNNTISAAMDTEAIKGGSRDEQELNARVIGSNSVYMGVSFSLSQAVTPDKVEENEKYYREVILKDPEISVTAEDQTKIFNAFTAAKEKSQEDLAFLLAVQARKMTKEKGWTADQAEQFIVDNSRGSTKTATQGYNLYVQDQKAIKAQDEKQDREVFGKARELMQSGRPVDAELELKKMTPKEQLVARKYLDDMEGGGAKAFSKPEHRKSLADLWRTNPAAAAKENLDKYYLSRADRRSEENRKRVYEMDIQNKNFAIDNGALEAQAERMAINIATSSMGYKMRTDPKLAAQIRLNSRDILYEVRVKYPNLVESGVIMGHVRDKLVNSLNGALKETQEPNAAGQVYKFFGGDPMGSSWMNSEKTKARPSEEFGSTDQTGGRDKIRVAEPTIVDINKFKAEAKSKGKKVPSDDEAYSIIMQIRRANKVKASSGSF